MQRIASPEDQRVAATDDFLWKQLGKSPRDQIREVNQWFNWFDYEGEGERDYWATPREFIVRGRGDCEDFAIAKYFALASLGHVGMRLALVPWREDESHMVLLADLEGALFVLDCPPKAEVVPAEYRQDLNLHNAILFDCDWLWFGDHHTVSATTIEQWKQVLWRA